MPNLLSRLRGLVGLAPASPPPEARAINGEETWYPTPTLAGVVVTPETVTNFAAAYSAINVLASDVGSIPFNLMRRDASGGRAIDYEHPVHDLICNSPNEEMSSLSFYQTMLWHANVWGNAYAEIERDRLLRPVAMWLLDPRVTGPKRSGDGSLYYRSLGTNLLARDVIHVANVGSDGILGKSPIQECRQSFGLSMAVEQYGAAYFGNGIHEKGILSTDQSLDEEEEKDLIRRINRQHQGPYNAHRFLLLTSNFKYTSTTIPPEDAQFLSTRKFQLEEVARIYRVPLSKLQNLDHAHFANLEETNVDYYQSSLMPWIRRIEVALLRKLFTRDQRRTWSVEHDSTYSLKGRMVDQATVERTYKEIGVLSPNEIRARHGWAPIEGGDTYMVPLNMAPMGKIAAADIETLKGVKKLPPPEDVTDEVDDPILVSDGDQVAGLRSAILAPTLAVLRDTAARMTRREAGSLRKILKKGDLPSILDALDAFYGVEGDYLASAYTGPVRLYGEARGRPLEPRALADRIVSMSRADITACVEGDGTMKALAELADRWEADRPDQILATLEALGL